MICANALWYLNIYSYNRRKGLEERRIVAYIEAVAMWMLCAFLLLEGLSLFQGISQFTLGICWLVIDVILLVVFLRQRQSCRSLQFTNYFPINECRKKKGSWCLAAIGVWVVALALLTVPYNWDTMTYRLSRIAYWAQNGSVEHFATNCSRALSNPPLGEFVQLHIYLLCGKSDILVNLMQAFSYLTCAVLVYALAKLLKCTGAFCFLATLLFMSMPIAFAEALNTQVDLFSAVWLLSFVYLLTDFAKSKEKIIWSGDNIFKVCIMGLCVAWGYLSKPNVCVAMLIFALWLLVNCIVRKDKIIDLFRLALCALGSMIVPMAWEISRNLQTYHAISAPSSGARQLVGTLEWQYLLLNFLKNISYNLPVSLWNRGSAYMASFLWQLATKLGASLDAEVISEDGRPFIYPVAPDYNHDTAINPLIVWLLIICLVWSVICFRKIQWKKLYQSYPLVATAGFLIFCVILRWEPFMTRYMLPFLALLCPGIACMLQRQLGKANSGKATMLVVGIISVLCVISVADMSKHHWKIVSVYGANSRPYGYFVNRTPEYEPVMEIVEYIREGGYEEIGIFHGEDDYEYPYWALLGEQVIRMEHVGVTNESAMYIDTEYQPQCIIWYGNAPTEVFEWNGRAYPNVVEIAENRYVLTTS